MPEDGGGRAPPIRRARTRTRTCRPGSQEHGSCRRRLAAARSVVDRRRRSWWTRRRPSSWPARSLLVVAVGRADVAAAPSAGGRAPRTCRPAAGRGRRRVDPAGSRPRRSFGCVCHRDRPRRGDARRGGLDGSQLADRRLVRRHRQPRSPRRAARSRSPSTTARTSAPPWPWRPCSRLGVSAPRSSASARPSTVGRTSPRPRRPRPPGRQPLLFHDSVRWLDPRYPELGAGRSSHFGASPRLPGVLSSASRTAHALHGTRRTAGRNDDGDLGRVGRRLVGPRSGCDRPSGSRRGAAGFDHRPP